MPSPKKQTWLNSKKSAETKQTVDCKSNCLNAEKLNNMNASLFADFEHGLKLSEPNNSHV
jgi:hypothetical protein